MDDVAEKIQRGFDLLARAEDDDDLVGVALLAFHGALENYIDGELAFHEKLSDDERQLLGRGQLGWKQRAALAQKLLHVPPDFTPLVLDRNRWRQHFAHGGQFMGTAELVQEYGEYVATICDQPIPQLEPDVISAKRSSTLRPSKPVQAASTAPVRRPSQPASLPAVPSAVFLLICALVVAVLMVMLYRAFVSG